MMSISHSQNGNVILTKFSLPNALLVVVLMTSWEISHGKLQVCENFRQNDNLLCSHVACRYGTRPLPEPTSHDGNFTENAQAIYPWDEFENINSRLRSHLPRTNDYWQFRFSARQKGLSWGFLHMHSQHWCQMNVLMNPFLQQYNANHLWLIVPGRLQMCNFWDMIRIKFMGTFDNKSTLVQIMAWYLSQCWPRSTPPYGVIRP